MHAKSQWVSQSVLTPTLAQLPCHFVMRNTDIKVMNFLPNYTPQEDKNGNQTQTQMTIPNNTKICIRLRLYGTPCDIYKKLTCI